VCSFVNAILFNKIVSGVSTLSDIYYLAQKEKDGKILDASGNRTTTGVLCEIDVPDGKTFYLAYANAWITDMNAAGQDNAEIKLEEDDTGANTQVGEIKVIGNAASVTDNAIQQGEVSGMDLFSEFKGKLVFVNTSGGAVKVRLRVSSIAGAAQVRGTIRGWTETNGESPAV